MDQNASLRYQFEHELFRDLFYRAPSTVLRDLETGGSNYMDFLWKKALELQDGPDDSKEELAVYTQEDFSVQIGEKNGLKYGIIRTPKATAAMQCSHIGLVLSQDESYQNYCTVERMASGDYILCGWSFRENGMCHNNYMKFSKREEKIAKDMIHEMLSPKTR